MHLVGSVLPEVTLIPPLMPPIRVKVLSQLPVRQWLHQLPHGEPIWWPCEFIFDPDARHYDWLVVYDDVPRRTGQARDEAQEDLACPTGHTLLVTTEPSSIKIYGSAFTAQFGAVLTSQEAWALPHRLRIFSQPALHWFYGVGADHCVPYDNLQDAPPAVKSKQIAMVFSPKSMAHTLHRQRHNFMRFLMQHLPEMDVYGRGAHPLDDKAESLADYRYHVAVENFIGPHHWTEKLADAFLGLTLPFYCGCPNATDYFPAESFIPIDISNPEQALLTIRQAMTAGEYEKRLPAIREARRRVMQEYNLFAVLAQEIQARHNPSRHIVPGAQILSRHSLRRVSLGIAVSDVFEKVRGRLIHATRPWRGG